MEIAAGPVIEQLAQIPGLQRVLGVCSVVSDGLRLGPQDEVADGAVVDVLPPFAGG